MLKAPAGGLVSTVNGERYEGGEFMPEHGLYCGQGSARIKKTELEAIRSKLDAEHKIEWDEAGQCWAVYQLVKFAAGFSDWQRQMNYHSAKTLKKYWQV